MQGKPKKPKSIPYRWIPRFDCSKTTAGLNKFLLCEWFI